MSEITKSPGKATEAMPQGTVSYTRLSKALFGFGCKIKPTAEQQRSVFPLTPPYGQ